MLDDAQNCVIAIAHKFPHPHVCAHENVLAHLQFGIFLYKVTITQRLVLGVGKTAFSKKR